MAKDKFLTYEARITQTKEDIKARQVASYVAKSSHNFTSAIHQGVGRVNDAEAAVITAQVRVDDCNEKLDAAMATKPINIQGILDARADLEAAEQNVTDCKEEVTTAKDDVKFLRDLQGKLGL